MKTQDYLNEDSLFLSAKNLQRFVGYFGFYLPILLFLFTYIFDGYALPLESISHYYYTRAGLFFIVVVFAIALFLFFYKGENGSKKNDDWVTTVAAIMAVLVLFLPTYNIDLVTYPDMEVVQMAELNDNEVRSTAHNIFAGGFFLLLSYISYFRFPSIERKLEEKIQEQQRLYPLNQEVNHVFFNQIRKFEEKIETRNKIFRACAIIMWVALAFLLLSFVIRYYDISPEFNIFYVKYRLTFVIECILIWAFAFSWFTKGKDYFG